MSDISISGELLKLLIHSLCLAALSATRFQSEFVVTTQQTPSHSQRPVARAIRGAGRYVSFGRPVLFQVEYTGSLSSLYLFQPLDIAWGGQPPEKEKWAVKVSLLGKTNVSLTGKPKGGESGSEQNRQILNAVEISAQAADEAGLLHLPVIISARSTSKGYLVLFTTVPPTPGDETVVELSRNYTVKSIDRGH